MSELGEWVVVPGFDEALQRVMAQQTDPLVESIGELRLICNALCERVEQLERPAKEPGHSYTLKDDVALLKAITFTDPPEYEPWSSDLQMRDEVDP